MLKLWSCSYLQQASDCVDLDSIVIKYPTVLCSSLSLFFSNVLINCCYKAVSLNGNSFSLPLGVCGRKNCCLTAELFKRRRLWATLTEVIPEMTETVESWSRKYVKAIKGRDLAECVGSPWTQFTFELKYTTATASVFLVSDADCFSSLQKPQQHIYSHIHAGQEKWEISVLVLGPYFIHWWCNRISFQRKVTFCWPVTNELWQEKSVCTHRRFQSLMQLMRDRWNRRLYFHSQSTRTIWGCCWSPLFFSGVHTTNSLPSPVSGVFYLHSLYFLHFRAIFMNSYGDFELWCKYVSMITQTVWGQDLTSLAMLSETCFDLSVYSHRRVNWLGVRWQHHSGLPPVRSLIIWVEQEDKTNTVRLICPFLCCWKLEAGPWWWPAGLVLKDKRK